MLQHVSNATGTSGEARAVKCIDFGTLLSDDQRKAILTVMVRCRVPMTARQIGARLIDEPPEIQKDIPSALKRMKDIGVIQQERGGESPSYLLSDPMAQALTDHLAPQQYAVSEDSLSREVVRKLRSQHMKSVRAALKHLVSGSDEQVTQYILQDDPPQSRPTGHALEAKITAVRTSLSFLCQYGLAVGKLSEGGGMTFFHLQPPPGDRSEPAEDAGVAAAGTRNATVTEPRTKEQCEADAIREACVKALTKGSLSREKLQGKVREARGAKLPIPKINKAVTALVRDGVIVFKAKKGYSLVTEDDDDGTDEEDGVTAPGRDMSEREVADRVGKYLEEARQWQQDEGGPPSALGPRTPERRLRDYLEACACKDETGISELLRRKQCEPYELFVAHQEYCTAVQSHLLHSFGKEVRGMIGTLPSGATQNLRKHFPKEALPEAVRELRAMDRCNVALVRKFLRRSLPQYRDRVL